jgi:tetratricopeptide (TPR) repeat protein
VYALKTPPHGEILRLPTRRYLPLCLLLIAAASARAQNESDWEKCRDRVPQAVIAGCTEVIRTPGETTTGVAVAFNNRGVANGRIGRFDLAIADFTQAIEMNSNFIGWSEEGAVSWAEAAETKAANNVASISMLNQKDAGDDTAKTTPDAALFYKNRGVAYYRSGKYSAAVADFTQAMSRRTHYFEALLDRGVAHADAAQYDLAIEDYESAMQINAADPAPFVDRGALYARQEKYLLAIADYERAIALRPDYAPAYGGRCMAYAILGTLQPAMDDCNAALDISPTLSSALESRGFAELKLGQYEQSRTDYAAALKTSQNPESGYKPESLYGRGLAEQQLGLGDAAEADIAAAQKLDPNIADEFARWGISAMRKASSPAKANGSQEGPR